MAPCSVCNVDTRYRCITCHIFICNRNPSCHVQVEEDGIAGWQMGSAVALCHNCCDNGRDNAGISNLLESDQPSHSQGETSQSIASFSLRQVQFDCASRGFHEYRQIWNPRIGQKLDIEQDYGSINDPFSMAINISIGKQWATFRGKSADFATIPLTMVEPSRPAYEM